MLPANVSGFARDAEEQVGACIVWFQLVVSDAPVLNRVVFGQAFGAVFFSGTGEHFEAIRQKSGAHRAPVLPCTADTGAGKERTVLAKGKGALARIVPERHRFLGNILHHAEANGVVQFIHVVAVVVGLSRPSAFQHDHGKCSTRAKFLGHQQACPSAPDNHHVHGWQCLHSRSSPGRTLRRVTSRKLAGFGRNASPKCLSTSS